jgi:bacterioferritin-associated ferredoxin
MKYQLKQAFSFTTFCFFLKACEYCDYTNSNSDKVVKHIALGHSKLDEMLADEKLLIKKRALAQLKPKKQNIGPNCPVCDVRDPPREHVARHFSDELMELVTKLPDQNQCGQCQYRGERAKNLGLHIALVHGQLDTYLDNVKLVRAKRNKFLAQPKKQAIGPTCPVCDLVFTKSQNRFVDFITLIQFKGL